MNGLEKSSSVMPAENMHDDTPTPVVDDDKNENAKATHTESDADDVGDENVNDSSDDEDDDYVDPLAMIKPPGMRNSGVSSSLRRVDSWESFVSRSERSSLLGKDIPPSLEEASKRAVKFCPDEELETVFEIEPIETKYKHLVWLSDQDFERFDIDVRLTLRRWENHSGSRYEFEDPQVNTMRGLETAIDNTGEARVRHYMGVLKDIHNQKVEGRTGQTMDWERVRATSIRLAADNVEKALVMGKADREAMERAWDPSITEKQIVKPVDKDSSTKKKKMGIFSKLFKKK